MYNRDTVATLISTVYVINSRGLMCWEYVFNEPIKTPLQFYPMKVWESSEYSNISVYQPDLGQRV